MRNANMNTLHLGWITGPAILAVCCWSAGAAPADSGTLTLTLAEGVEDGSAMVLDLSAGDGRFDKDLWGTAYGYNLAQHTGTVDVADAPGDNLRVSVKLCLEADTVAPAGRATYDLSLTRKEGAFSGSFTGLFNDVAVTGIVTGAMKSPAVKAVQGFEVLQSGEHPRLIFRKRELPELRRRMDTPEGKAIAAMLNERAPLRDVAQVSDRHSSWMAANWGAIYQLNGDTNAPRLARETLMNEVITKPMPWDRKDIHHASRLLGVALAYDLCHDAWDDAFRRLLAEYIRISASELSRGRYEGFNMDDKTWDPAPWGHRNAVRMACAGFATTAIAGDPDSAGRILPDTDRILRVADRHVEQYLLLGVTQSGVGLEGPFHRDFALANGVLHFLHAARVARGRDFSSVNPMLLAGNVLGTRPGADNTFDFALSGITIQTSGLWPIGLGTVRPNLLPALKWCFDRDAGLQGKQHFGCAYPYQAAYALKNYPFEVQAREPGEAFPLFATDPVNGHLLLRNRWKDGEDVVVQAYANARGLPPPRGKEDDLSAGILSISGFGTNWFRGFAGASRMNDKAAGALLYSETDGRQAVIGMDLSALYLPTPPKQKPRGGMTRQFGVIQKYQWQRDEIQKFLRPDKSAKGAQTNALAAQKDAAAEPVPHVVRHIAVDLSGKCGAPVLVAIADRSEGTSAPFWRIPTAAPVTGAGPGWFVCGATNDVHLSGRVVAPADARVSGGRLPAKGDVFVVATLQNGAPPAVQIEGTGLGAKVTVGGQTVSFNGERFVLGR
jgi:hypothetical protein